MGEARLMIVGPVLRKQVAIVAEMSMNPANVVLKRIAARAATRLERLQSATFKFFRILMMRMKTY
ncbi:hypothetical protein HPB47_002567 [Ixodes persulcatus]|uniref:Uncharacterized protein n=1 Tax=Ixodes persulcatus TaxID=34615 RepID=A0AC60PLV5_IXOPE|nr:hypothetical protein HPB47_002567 [Ixodes persulcatus]